MTATLPLPHAIQHNLTLQDILGSLLATLAFTAVLYAPGYLTAYAANLLNFRRLPFAARSLWAIACSFIVTPIAAYGIARALNLTTLCWLFAAAALAAAILLRQNRTASTAAPHNIRRTASIVLGWAAFCLLMLVDLQIGHRLYFSVVTADQSYRIAFTDAVLRTGVPPANPLYFTGAPAPMHYYYFWYILCAAVAKLAHVTARQAFIAGSLWAGFGLLVTVQLYATHFFHWTRRQTSIALALLVVSGADLIPALGNVLLQPSLNGDIEWWSVDPIDAWPDSLLWVPHHVAGVLCCLLAFLLLWRTLEPLTTTITRARRSAVVLAALAFASAFGLSVYVAFGFALMMLAWLLRLAILRHPDRVSLYKRVAAASLLSAALLAPFLLELLHTLPATTTAQPAAQPAHLFSLSVRRMIDSGLLTGLPLFAGLNRSHPILLDQTLRLLLLIPGLAMELGLYGVVLILLLRAKRTKQLLLDAEPHSTALFFIVTGLLLTLFVSSSVITNNDFGYRAVMLPQFFLLLLTADLLGSHPLTPTFNLPSPHPKTLPSRPERSEVESSSVGFTPTIRRLLYTLLALGLAGSLYGAILLRAWLPLEARRTPIFAELDFTQLPDEAFQIRAAFASLHRVASPQAVVAFRPIDPEVHTHDEVMTPNEFYQRLLVMNAGHQMLNAEWKCAVHFGGDPSPCPAIQSQTTQLYAASTPTAAWAQSFCSRFAVQYLAIGHRDPAWSNITGWPATLPVIARQPGFRILQCAPDPH